jgi:hypothetical protein
LKDATIVRKGVIRRRTIKQMDEITGLRKPGRKELKLILLGSRTILIEGTTKTMACNESGLESSLLAE